MSAPKMIVEVLALTEKVNAKGNAFMSVFITGGVNILVNETDPAYNYIKKGLELTVQYDKVVPDTYPDGKPFVKYINAKVIDINNGATKVNPFAHLEAVRTADQGGSAIKTATSVARI